MLRTLSIAIAIFSSDLIRLSTGADPTLSPDSTQLVKIYGTQPKEPLTTKPSTVDDSFTGAFTEKEQNAANMTPRGSSTLRETPPALAQLSHDLNDDAGMAGNNAANGDDGSSSSSLRLGATSDTITFAVLAVIVCSIALVFGIALVFHHRRRHREEDTSYWNDAGDALCNEDVNNPAFSMMAVEPEPAAAAAFGNEKEDDGDACDAQAQAKMTFPMMVYEDDDSSGGTKGQ